MKKIRSICIIDDDPITVFGINRLLKSIDICDDIRTYNNGKVAIDGIKELLKENKEIPEVIFLDINMPIMDGWQFLEEFISLHFEKKVRINIITSSIDPFDLQRCDRFKAITHHVIEFNNKPISRQEIQEITKVA